MKYDIFLLADLVTGLGMNSKYRFPIHSFSEKLCEEYGAKYHMGYFSILFYYEREKAIKNFFEYAEGEQIFIEDNVQNEDFYIRLVSLIKEIERRPGQYITKNDARYIRAFIKCLNDGVDDFEGMISNS